MANNRKHNNVISINCLLSGMVESLCELFGESVADKSTETTYWDFPSLAQMAGNQDTVEAQLRGRSFGYRAGYIAKVV